MKLKQLRKESGFTQKQLAEMCDISESMISNLEHGKKSPSFETLLKLGEALNCSVDDILFEISEPKALEDAHPLVKKYNALDAHGKEAVDSILDLEYKRCARPVKAPTKVIPLFPAAAGPTDQRDEEPFEEYETDQDADFAVRISGDSMEPELHDGEIVLCKKRKPKDGEIAVISVNGSILVKQYISDSFGNLYLRSLNRKRQDSDMDIMASGNLSVRGYGTVIHKRIPLVKQ